MEERGSGGERYELGVQLEEGKRGCHALGGGGGGGQGQIEGHAASLRDETCGDAQKQGGQEAGGGVHEGGGSRSGGAASLCSTLLSESLPKSEYCRELAESADAHTYAYATSYVWRELAETAGARLAAARALEHARPPLEGEERAGGKEEGEVSCSGGREGALAEELAERILDEKTQLFVRALCVLRETEREVSVCPCLSVSVSVSVSVCPCPCLCLCLCLSVRASLKRA